MMKLPEILKKPRVFVDGQFEELSDAPLFDKVNPSDEASNPSVVLCSQKHVDVLAANSAEAFQSVWRKTPPADRKTILLRVAELLRSRVEHFACLDSLEMGRPITSAQEDVMVAAGFFQYYGETIDKSYGQTAPGAHGYLETQRLVPHGVVLAITPWNFPLINAALKIAPALAAGNCVIVKPSEHGVYSTLILAELMIEAGLPKGVVNVVPGDGKTAQALIASRHVDMVTFTGSSQTGSLVMQAAGQAGLKPVALECGGKNPQIVFADAISDEMIGHIAGFIAFTTMWNSGQVCVQKSRLLVEASVAEPLTAIISQISGSMQVGNASDAASALGPLAYKQQYDRVITAIAQAEEQGAELLLDGRQNGAGFFVGPTIFTNGKSSPSIWDEEVFGPVLSIETFTSEEDAIALANDTPYGLSASVWTSNLSRGHRLGEELEAGKISIMSRPGPPDGCWAAHSAEPSKRSGFGVEGGMEALKTYSRRKATQFVY